MVLRRDPDRPRSRGQALVEFALILPLLALLLVMAVDFGRVFFGYIALQNATRIAADMAAGQAESWPANGAQEQNNQNRYRDSFIRDLTAINCFPADGAWDRADVPDPAFVDMSRPPDGETQGAGDHAVVTIQCSFDLLTPLAEGVLGGPVTVGASEAFPVNYQLSVAVPSLRPLPTPTPVPTPSPGPVDCTIPNYVSLRANDAENLWDASDFTGTFTKVGSGNFTIVSQSLVPPGATVPCTSSITVSSGAVPTPTPTPPGATPTPTPSCARAVANFIANPTSGNKPLLVNFTDTSSAPAGCPITAWNWTFGDNSTPATTQNTTHIYTFQGQGQPRTYNATLTVTNAGGTSNPRTVTITVSP